MLPIKSGGLPTQRLFRDTEPHSAAAAGATSGDGANTAAEAFWFAAAGVIDESEHPGPGQQSADQGDDQ